MSKTVYVRCPRCELNYIKKGEKLCSVCQSEISGKNPYDELDLELCPVCKTNYILPEEIMCATCAKEKSIDLKSVQEDPDAWNEYVNDDEEFATNDEDELTTVSDLDDEELIDSDLLIDLDDDDDDKKDKDDEDEDDDLDEEIDDDDFDESLEDDEDEDEDDEDEDEDEEY
ncbi:MAG: hypothetical protein RR400_00745 [Clostridia bacterium]